MISKIRRYTHCERKLKNLMSIIKAQSRDEVTMLQGSNGFSSNKFASEIQPVQKIKQLKCPPPYDQKYPTEWSKTHGTLFHIYQLDFVERNLNQSPDFFVYFYNVAIMGTAKSIVSGYSSQ